MKHETALQNITVPTIVPLLPEDRFFHKLADLHELLARQAYEHFVERGYAHGHDLEDWLRAESELLTLTPLELYQTQHSITLKTAIPGYRTKDIEIHVEPRRVFITGQQSQEWEEKAGKPLRSEHSKRLFRSLDLPVPIDPAQVTATFDGGILQVELPTAKAAQHDTATARAAA